MSGHKRTLAHHDSPLASAKRRKPSAPFLDLTADDNDDDGARARVQPAQGSSWLPPWRDLFTQPLGVFRERLARFSNRTTSPAKNPRRTASPRIPPTDHSDAKSELAQLKKQHQDLRGEHQWKIMDARAANVPEPEKPQSILELEDRMKALRLRIKKLTHGSMLKGGPPSSSASGSMAESQGARASHQRKKPMGSDKIPKERPLPLTAPPTSASRCPPSPPPRTSRTVSPPAPVPTARVLRPPWSTSFDPGAPRSPSPPSSPSVSPPPPVRTSRRQHKLAIAQRDADTIADLRSRSSQVESASRTHRVPFALPQEDAAEDAPEAEDDLALGLYAERLESGLRQEQEKHDATFRTRPSQRHSGLVVGRSTASIAGRSPLDLASVFPRATPLAVAAQPAVPKRGKSDVDYVLATAKKTLAEPLRDGPDAFERFDLLGRALKEADVTAQELEVVKVKKRKFPKELAPEDAARVKMILRNPRYETSIPGAAAANKDLRRLQGLAWLNDELVNFIGVLINRRSDEADKSGERGDGERRLRKAFCFNTNFFTWYGDSGFAKVKRWTRRFDTFEKDIIIIPINHNNNHWCCAAINLKLKRFEYYDSFGSPSSFVYERLRNWLADEHRNRKKSEIDLSDWTDYWYEDVPQQQNVSDCGVFTCMFMESLSREVDFFDFSQKHMPYLRNKMVLQIDKHDLLDIEPWA